MAAPARDRMLRSEYGAGLLVRIAETLTAEFGSGFDTSNLRNMRMLLQAFPIRDALRLELSWTHYPLLMRLDDVCAQAQAHPVSLYARILRVSETCRAGKRGLPATGACKRINPLKKGQPWTT